jgi:thiamine pyrophosphate-dependent acetolactate synthase large subunit-like protein
MRGCVKWADRVYNLKRIPGQVNSAFQHTMSGKPGPIYLDFPGDLLDSKIEEEQVDWSMKRSPAPRCASAGRSRAGCPDPGAVKSQEARHCLWQRRDLVARLDRDA